MVNTLIVLLNFKTQLRITSSVTPLFLELLPGRLYHPGITHFIQRNDFFSYRPPCLQ